MRGYKKRFSSAEGRQFPLTVTAFQRHGKKAYLIKRSSGRELAPRSFRLIARALPFLCDTSTLLVASLCTSRFGLVRSLWIVRRPVDMETTQSAQVPPKEPKKGVADLDPKAYTCMKVNSYRENLKALNSVEFRRPAGAQDRHLDLGCGPGNFLQDELLPRLRPCRRMVGADNSQDMLHFARSNCRQPEVLFELLDIEQGDPQALVDKYGPFDRVYSFLAFHYVRDLEKAYRNVHKLLKDGGECLVVYFTKTGIQDAWHLICESEEWKDFVPDLRAMFADRSKSGKPMTQEQYVVNERTAVTSAGLEMVDCRTYTSQWIFPTADACLSAGLPFFKLEGKVPEEKRTAFWEACKSALLQVSTMTPEGINLPFDIIVAHAQKPVVCP